MAAIRNAAGPTLFKRFFGLVENQPLYVMVGIACGLAVYTPVRHLTHAADVALGPACRDVADALAPGGATLQKGVTYRTHGVLARAARLHSYPEVISSAYGVPDRSHWAQDKPLYLPKEMPAPPVA